MKFWCIRCEDAFDHELPPAELEQAKCPTCSAVCLSFQAEWEEAVKNEKFSSTVTSTFGLILGRLMGRVVAQSNPRRSRILDYADAVNYVPEHLVASTAGEATRLQLLLGDHGVICVVRQTSSGDAYYLDVEERDAVRARRILERERKT